MLAAKLVLTSWDLWEFRLMRLKRTKWNIKEPAPPDNMWTRRAVFLKVWYRESALLFLRARLRQRSTTNPDTRDTRPTRQCSDSVLVFGLLGSVAEPEEAWRQKAVKIFGCNSSLRLNPKNVSDFFLLFLICSLEDYQSSNDWLFIPDNIFFDYNHRGEEQKNGQTLQSFCWKSRDLDRLLWKQRQIVSHCLYWHFSSVKILMNRLSCSNPVAPWDFPPKKGKEKKMLLLGTLGI